MLRIRMCVSWNPNSNDPNFASLHRSLIWGHPSALSLLLCDHSETNFNITRIKIMNRTTNTVNEELQGQVSNIVPNVSHSFFAILCIFLMTLCFFLFIYLLNYKVWMMWHLKWNNLQFC